MSTEYYDHSTYPAAGSSGSSASMRAELEKIETGFSLLPVLAGNGGKIVVVNGGGTALTTTSGQLTIANALIQAGAFSLTLTTTGASNVTMPLTGTLATLGGTETLTNKTLTSPIISGAWTILTSTQTGHGIGTAAVAGSGLALSLTATGPGSGIARGLYSLSTLTGGVSDDIRGAHFSSTITKAGSGTHADVDGVNIGVPSISGAATATRGSTLRINGPPASGATNLYALRVESGTSYLGGLLDISAAAAGQISFPASQNASAGANILDDYREGTWTPSLGGSATYTTRGGRYTKIGNVVTIWGLIVVNAIGTGSTTTISGLPFTATNTVANMDFNGSASVASSVTNVVSIHARVDANASVVTFPTLTAAAATHGTAAIFQNGTGITFCVTYMV